MEFITKPKVTHNDVPVSAHFDGRCLQCTSTDTKIRSSYKRDVVDLGTPIEQRIARVTMATGDKITVNGIDFQFSIDLS